jgi:predicted metal-binding membrane protein
MFSRAATDRRVFMGLLVGLILLAWVSLWVWGQSPYGRYLDHQNLSGVTLEGAAQILLFLAGWTLMIVAMMLPTSLPLITLFFTINRGKKERPALVYLLLAGYLSLWTCFGLAVLLGDWLLHFEVSQSTWLLTHPWIISATILAAAGVYQFSPLKYHCLEKCRSPFSFIAEYWRGKNERKQAFRLGVRHGLFCIGCCWSLMLVMFAVGMGNFGLMLGLGTAMAVEKNTGWGKVLSPLLGTALLLGGFTIILTSLHLVVF